MLSKFFRIKVKKNYALVGITTMDAVWIFWETKAEVISIFSLKLTDSQVYAKNQLYFQNYNLESIATFFKTFIYIVFSFRSYVE